MRKSFTSALLLALLGVAPGCSLAADEDVDSAESAATAAPTASLDKDVYVAGQTMTLEVKESYAGARTTKISDSGGQTWTKTSDNGHTMTWTAVATGGNGQFKVTATITPGSGGAPLSASDTYTRGTTMTTKALLGMSAPDNLWDQRVREVGPGLEARRLFFNSFDAGLGKAEEACAAGMYPILSFKTGSYSWAQVAAGNADAALRGLATRAAALPCDSFIAIHHEPAKDGAASDWAAMQMHALPIVGGPLGGKVKVGVIANGWWWSKNNQGYTDAEIAEYIPRGVIAVSDVIAADTYQTSDTGEEPAPKMIGMGEWARRVGGVRALGVGEFNGHSAASITNATKALAADPLFAWGCVWNSDGPIASVLTGDRLAAFRAALAAW